MENGVDLGVHESGEIWIRGPQVMQGYWRSPEATSSVLDDEGWLRTGDVGYADDNGFFYIVDRVKELIKYKGFQVAPAELEAILLSHTAVSDAAVIGSPDEEAGEVPKAFIVATESVSAEEIMEFVADQVAPYKKIRRLQFIEQVRYRGEAGHACLPVVVAGAAEHRHLADNFAYSNARLEQTDDGFALDETDVLLHAAFEAVPKVIG